MLNKQFVIRQILWSGELVEPEIKKYDTSISRKYATIEEAEVTVTKYLDTYGDDAYTIIPLYSIINE